ncbi:MAG: RIO1 family regulatory kinase/ATPase domain-containing protein [Candidatus Kariarchaeaceae archaeon]|jgi:RIO kinase 2
MTLIGAEVLSKLNKKELRVLQGIEVGMRNSEYVEVEMIAKFAGYSVSETERWLRSCHKMDLIHRWSGHFVGYELTIHGYDALALNALYMKNEVLSIGREKGVGKESRVFYALDADQQEVVIKLHRVGYTSFQHVRKKRRYTANKRHISELYASRLSAEEEAKWLQKAIDLGLNVPKLWVVNRHILKLELIDGIDLVKLKNIPEPMETLDEIIEFIKTCWQQGGFVHGDLSEHNIIMRHSDARPVVIDFPQAVPVDEENAFELLERDILNVLTYFDRKLGIKAEYDKVLEYITEE